MALTSLPESIKALTSSYWSLWNWTGYRIQGTRCRGKAPGTSAIASVLASVINAEIAETITSFLGPFPWLGEVPWVVAFFVAVVAGDLAKVLAFLPTVCRVDPSGQGTAFSSFAPFSMRLFPFLLPSFVVDVGSLLGSGRTVRGLWRRGRSFW